MAASHELAEARRRWAHLWRELGAEAVPDALFDRLVAAYGEEHRAYHDLTHVLDCLRELEAAAGWAERPLEIEAALWFHDAVYDPRRHDNEQRSARWAGEALRAHGVPEAAVARVEALVMATRHEAPVVTLDEKLMVDIDLSILGRDPEAFARYEAQIRREYDFVPDDAYRRARAGVLTRFRSRTPLYATPPFRQRYESQARHNLGERGRSC